MVGRVRERTERTVQERETETAIRKVEDTMQEKEVASTTSEQEEIEETAEVHSSTDIIPPATREDAMETIHLISPEPAIQVRPSIPSSVCAYIMCKRLLEQTEDALARNTPAETPAYALGQEDEVKRWEAVSQTLGMSTEGIREEIEAAFARSLLNEARIPQSVPDRLTMYIHNTNIPDPVQYHEKCFRVKEYVGEDERLRKGFGKHGKDFSAIRATHMPWRTTEEIVLLYYRKKQLLNLRIYQGMGRDTRKMKDTELRELITKEWTAEEKEVFLQLLVELGKKWSLYPNVLRGKSERDVKTFYRYYKRFLFREEEAKKKVAVKKKEEPAPWAAHERQTFALLFPHIGKNWSVLSNYIVTKTASEIRSYHRLFYKNLSVGEKILETHLKDLGKPEIRTDLWALPRPPPIDHHARLAGVLFKSTALRRN